MPKFESVAVQRTYRIRVLNNVQQQMFRFGTQDGVDYRQ